jgi:hypothetical protein
MRVFNSPSVSLSLISIVYFTVASILATKLFYNKQKLELTTVIIITSSLLIFSFIIPLLNEVYPLTITAISNLLEKGFYYPLLKVETSLTKACDVFFQQIMIYFFILKYLKYYDRKSDIIIKFSVIFFIIHIPLFILFGWLALLFIIPSIIAGIVFSALILNLKNGLTYSFITHQLFYVCIAIGYRI